MFYCNHSMITSFPSVICSNIQCLKILVTHTSIIINYLSTSAVGHFLPVTYSYILIYQVFLKYWHPEQLNIAMNVNVQKVVIVQRLVRGFIDRKKASRLKQILLARKQAQAKSFLMAIGEKSQLMFGEQRDLNNQDLKQHKLDVSLREKR